MRSSTCSGPAVSGATCPRTSRPRAPCGGTSTSGGTTAPPTPSPTRPPRRAPPKAPVGRSFAEWRPTAPPDATHARPRRKVRTQGKPYSPRTTASVDSQSVDTTSGGDDRGRDNAKNVDGRKRHIVVDSLGLLL